MKLSNKLLIGGGCALVLLSFILVLAVKIGAGPGIESMILGG